MIIGVECTQEKPHRYGSGRGYERGGGFVAGRCHPGGLLALVAVGASVQGSTVGG